jgi:hypothetical protein
VLAGVNLSQEGSTAWSPRTRWPVEKKWGGRKKMGACGLGLGEGKRKQGWGSVTRGGRCPGAPHGLKTGEGEPLTGGAQLLC